MVLCTSCLDLCKESTTPMCRPVYARKENSSEAVICTLCFGGNLDDEAILADSNLYRIE